MIHDLDTTLEKLIYERGKISRNEIDISFELPNSEWSARLNRPTVNMWCFDLRENVKLRNMDASANRPTVNGNTAARRLPMRRFDLTYLATTWARRIEDAHQLIWRILSVMIQVPQLEPHRCEGMLRDQPLAIPIMLGTPTERPVNLTDVWSVLDNQMRLGFVFTVTVVLDPEIVTESPLVFEKLLRVGQSDNPSDRMLTALDVEFQQKADRSSKEE
jgi:hypothetical protein